MKKSIWFSLSILSISGLIALYSCISSSEDPNQLLIDRNSNALSSGLALDSVSSAPESNYFERFTNHQISVDEKGIQTNSIPAYFPVTGEGNSSHMGKSYSYNNQYAFFGPNRLRTVGSPVTQFYSEQLKELGIFIDDENVSSITTDGKGNSVWYQNLRNIVTSVNEERSEYVAEVLIIGGTGKFEDAEGEAMVNGYFNPLTGEGMSTIEGKIRY